MATPVRAEEKQKTGIVGRSATENKLAALSTTAYMDSFQNQYCECKYKEFDGFHRGQAMRRASSCHSQASNEDHVLRYKDMKPIIPKTELYKDENGNLAISEESLHQMFTKLARRADEDDPTKRLFVYERDLAKKLPAQVLRHMKYGKKEEPTPITNTSLS